ncbi:MAG: hypothetical protein BGO41_05550 [Clostridiales bacterium 38-18]|nr:MAG: hypothetical protein BGO41_05550 [Clostridiales bacterium 38-18]
MISGNGIQDKLKQLLKRTIISFAIISGLLFYLFTYYQINDKYTNDAFSVIKLTNIVLENTFSDAENSLNALEIFVQNEDKAIDMTKTLNIFITNVKDASTMYVGYSDGRFSLYPARFVASDYDPRSRSWYINAEENEGSIVWTDPYVDHGTGEYAITASKKINDQMTIGVDILLSEITNIVENEKIGKNGFITILNTSGTIIATKNQNLLAKNWDEQAGSHIRFSEFKNGQVSHDMKNIYYSVKVKDKDLIIIGQISIDEILQSMLWIFILITFITFIIIYIAEKITIRYGNQIVQPVIALSKSIEKVTDGDMNIQCEVESDDVEIRTLIDGFNSMIQSINEKNLEMQALYEELYASEETLQEQYDLLYENKIFIEKSEQRYRSIFDASEEGLWDMDKNYFISYLTPNWYDNFNLNLDNSELNEWVNLIHEEDRKRVHDAIKNYIAKQIESYRIEYRVLNKNGEYVWIEAVGISKYENEEFISMSGSHQDITARKKYELHIQNMAYTDSLIRLKNRAYFEEKHREFIESGSDGTLLLIDINNFKYINDLYGHTFGDEILKQVANRLSSFSDHIDGNLARFSGNEFVFLLKNTSDYHKIVAIVKEICDIIETPLINGTTVLKINSSMGVTIFPKDGTSFEQIIQNADIAMFHARKVVKKSFYFFNEEIKNSAITEMNYEHLLRKAIEEDEFEVYYQPIMSIQNKNIKGFEALVRWQSKDLGFIMPDRFIPIAEKTRLINEIGLIVLEKACHFLEDISSLSDHELDMSVNISVIQLLEDNIVEKIIKIVERYKLEHHRIKLEITESITLESNESAIDKLVQLRNQGFGIALDDFGTGYSTFKNLIRLPLTGIKIDKAIMKESISSEHVYNLLESVVDFAHKINIDVVAEGIENLEYLDKSQKMDVDYVQGFHFSKPVPESQIISLIDSLDQLCLE